MDMWTPLVQGHFTYKQLFLVDDPMDGLGYTPIHLNRFREINHFFFLEILFLLPLQDIFLKIITASCPWHLAWPVIGPEAPTEQSAMSWNFMKMKTFTPSPCGLREQKWKKDLKKTLTSAIPTNTFACSLLHLCDTDNNVLHFLADIMWHRGVDQ